MTTAQHSPRIAVVLGGGGLKGFAHVGALKAIEELGIEPSRYAGTSIGALIAAAHVGGMPLDLMARRAASLARRDVFRLNHVGMLLNRMRAPSLYLEEPLRALAENNTPKCTFDALPTELFVNTVDLERGTIVTWGAPGLTDVRVSDAVYASCALPGFFPPGRVGTRHCGDGGTMDNLPVDIASQGMDLVIAVDVGNSDLSHDERVMGSGFASIYMRAATMMMYALQESALHQWSGPPMILVRPRLGGIGWFDFGHADKLVEAGYKATIEALVDWRAHLDMPGGIFPRRNLRLLVDDAKCTGCGLCAALAPGAMAMDHKRKKAFALTHHVLWSPHEGDFVRQCPTAAITCERAGAAEPRVPLPSMPIRPAAPPVALSTAPVVAPPAALQATEPAPAPPAAGATADDALATDAA